MARGHRQPKKNLRFSVLLEVLQDAFNKIPDQRNPQKINYQINDIYSSKDSPKVNFFQLTITDESGKVTYRSAWVTDIIVTANTIEELVRGLVARVLAARHATWLVGEYTCSPCNLAGR